MTADMVRGMAPGSVVVDLAAERGGNCELTRADQVVVEKGVTILGPTNLPSTVPYHASQMYAKNITTFLLHLVKNGAVTLDPADEITRDTLIAKDGEVVNARVRQALGRARCGGHVVSGFSRTSSSPAKAGHDVLDVRAFACVAAPSSPAAGFKITLTGIRDTSASIGDLSRNDSMNAGHRNAGRMRGAMPPPQIQAARREHGQGEIPRRRAVSGHKTSPVCVCTAGKWSGSADWEIAAGRSLGLRLWRQRSALVRKQDPMNVRETRTGNDAFHVGPSELFDQRICKGLFFCVSRSEIRVTAL